MDGERKKVFEVKTVLRPVTATMGRRRDVRALIPVAVYVIIRRNYSYFAHLYPVFYTRLHPVQKK